MNDAGSAVRGTLCGRRIVAGLEAKRPRLGALLAHAEVATLTPSAVTLAFSDRFGFEQAEKARAEIDSAISEVLRRPIHAVFTVGARAERAVRSEVGVENDAAAADRKSREQEARQHPLIRSAQDVFGASLKEIKT